MKSFVRRKLREFFGPLRRLRRPSSFPGSAEYWNSRYESGGNSGKGSYGELAQFKAKIINEFVKQHEINSVVEFGCGDGNQLQLATYPNYRGYDVSEQAVTRCRTEFSNDSSKQFELLTPQSKPEQAELTMSLDVIYHLVEDDIFDRHMRMLFDAALRYVIVYSSNFVEPNRVDGQHVGHRCFTDWVAANEPNWILNNSIENPYPFDPKTGEGSLANFFFYSRTPS